ncbi:MAG: hypothetical protein FWC54_01175 [Actinomycetia bacterium]|nr:hypothetical protein [Actinomycetes bacterium]
MTLQEIEMTGWKHAASDAPGVIAELRKLRDSLPFELHEIIVLGMGGSALATQVMNELFSTKGLIPSVFPRIQVVDTTSPAHAAQVLDGMDGAGTLLIVASKSGTTLEPNMLLRLCAERLAALLGGAQAVPQHCVALTDPGTALETQAREEGWRALITTPADVGGRYSALTAFGLAPLTLAGVDLEPLVARGRQAEARAGDARLIDFMVASDYAGRDVLLLVLPAELTPVGLWLEQLIAESLGKEGRGLIPIVTTPRRAEELLLLSPRTQTTCAVVTIGRGDDAALARVRETAQTLSVPVFGYLFGEPDDLGTLFADWMFSVAATGERLGINPFDQPDVAASKEATNRILASGQGGQASVTLRPLSELAAAAADPGAHYLALLAWLAYAEENDELLQRQAQELERQHGLPVAVEYGPRYLHSTGQGYKGGPATGLFVFVESDGDDPDLPIPGTDFSLAQVFAAQRQGDREALASKGRLLFGPLTLG